MTEKDPEYVNSKFSYNRKIATRCRICGGQLLTPEDMQLEMHYHCRKDFDGGVVIMG
tara:strand:- start:13826 stop:13996 length:171 start_codon:yes stop_codon:yes gene_type:complete